MFLSNYIFRRIFLILLVNSGIISTIDCRVEGTSWILTSFFSAF